MQITTTTRYICVQKSLEILICKKFHQILVRFNFVDIEILLQWPQQLLPKQLFPLESAALLQ